MRHMRHVKETLERRFDNPREGFIIETPFMTASEAMKFERNGVTVLRNGNITKFYAEDSKATGRLVEELTRSKALVQHALYNKYDEKIVIYPADNRMNDSLGESMIFENSRNNSPKSYFKRDLIKRILKGELERSEYAITSEFYKTELWDNTPDRIKKADVDFVMMKTKLDKEDEYPKTFVISYTYDKSSGYVSEITAIQSEFRQFLNNPAEYDVKFKRFTTKPTLLYITYNNKNGYNELATYLYDNYVDSITEARQYLDQGYRYESTYPDELLDRTPLLTYDEYVAEEKKYLKMRHSVGRYNSAVGVGRSGGSVDN